MKKILFMVSSMSIGGVEKSLLSLFSIISKETYSITLLLLEKNGGFLKHVPDWVRVEEVDWYRNLKPIIMQPPQKTIASLYYNKKFHKIIPFIWSYIISKKLNNRYLYYNHVFKNIPKHEVKYDIAISYQGPTDILDFFIATKVTAKKKISWIHFDVTQHSINKKLYKNLYRIYDKLFVVSSQAEIKLKELIPSVEGKTEVFMNIISEELIREMSTVNVDFSDEYGGFKIVTVGRLSKEKGQDIAIKVLADLRENGYNVNWYCVGEGSAREEYENLINGYNLNNHFFLLGEKDNPYPYIKNADIYVQPSRHEGYCLTLAEAKCLYKPIVVTNFTGANEQIDNGLNGLIVSCDVQELYETIKFLIDNPNQKELLTTNLKSKNAITTNKKEKTFNE
ncbi:glycosyltransferase [Aquibacillus halophilus]|uniref:Glycosyltransferase n=1 Tax=Aquibacillus halophilus TaxID=930132 RepID=A0A6A8DAG8_9BACI|nr:glycosyltransferase [Aquibacillus halophilus]MRH42705.1 glycosyltransferase [Aquibacillus halophilus]